MSWFLAQFVNAILQLIIALVIFLTNQLVQPLGLSPGVILAYFPGLNTVTDAFKILGIFITIVIVLFQLTRIIFSETSYGEKDNPIILLLRSGVAIALILASMNMMTYVFNVFSQPFYVITDDSGQKVFDITSDENIYQNTIDESFDKFIESAQNIKEEDYSDATTKITDWVFPGYTIIKAIIEIICILIVGYKFISLLLQILERYLLIMLQAFTSPLIYSSIASISTIGIFKKWLEMFIANFLLIYLNMFFLGLVTRSMGTIFNPDMSTIAGTNWKPNFVLGCAVIYAILKIIQSLDKILERILNTASINKGFGQELLMTVRLFQNTVQRLTGRGTVKTAGTGSTEIYKYTDRSEFDSGSNEVYPGSPGPKSPAGGTEREREVSVSKENLNQYDSKPVNYVKRDSGVKEDLNVEKAPENTELREKLENQNEESLLKEAYPVEKERERVLDDWGIPAMMSVNELAMLSGIDRENLTSALEESTELPENYSLGNIYRENGTLRVDASDDDGNTKTVAHLIPATEELPSFKDYDLLRGENQSYYIIPEDSSGSKFLESSASYKSLVDPGENLEYGDGSNSTAEKSGAIGQTEVKELSESKKGVDVSELDSILNSRSDNYVYAKNKPEDKKYSELTLDNADDPLELETEDTNRSLDTETLPEYEEIKR